MTPPGTVNAFFSSGCQRFDDRSHGETYQDYLFAMVEETARNGWVRNLCSHDHGTPTKQDFAKKCGWIADLITRAGEAGLRFASPPESMPH